MIRIRNPSVACRGLTMDHYRQSLDIDAAPAQVYAALTTPAGIRGWWTDDCEVPAGVGDTLRVRFDATRKAFRIERLAPDREVRWLCTEAHIAAGALARRDEWVGTRIVFRLAPLKDGRTRLDFEHVGLVPAFECHALCTQGWRYFLESLERFASTGTGTPFRQPAVAH